MMSLKKEAAPIGIFDSGYGGLTIFEKIQETLPEYDYIYLGDNARAPYGARSFEVVYEYTLQCVKQLFEKGCHLVILACNTASAKALRNIQQQDLEGIDPTRRVLGIIRPTAEVVGEMTETGHVGLLGTVGTIQSESYPIEINKIYPKVVVTGHACPMWVPLIEYGEYNTEGAEYFIKKDVDALIKEDEKIDTLILGCTHYPLVEEKVKRFLPEGVNILGQGEIVAKSLKDYLHRHPEMEEKCSKGGKTEFYTTENAEKFESSAKVFLKRGVTAKHLSF